MNPTHERYGIGKFAIGYLIYLVNARSTSSVHSPFIFNWSRSILHDRKRNARWNEIESLRAHLLKDKRLIGGGRSVSQIAKRAAKQPKYAQLLSRIAAFHHPLKVLELGTSLGISAAYISSALDDSAQFITIEGNEEIASLANTNLESIGSGANLRSGLFAEVLPNVLEELGRVDLVFFDGHHDYDATIEYFEMVLPYTHSNTVLIFDDINWSAGMQRAWKRIKAHERVTQTVDLYMLGIAFLREGVAEEHFVLRF